MKVTKEVNNTEEKEIDKDRMERTNRALTHQYTKRFKQIVIQALTEK